MLESLVAARPTSLNFIQLMRFAVRAESVRAKPVAFYRNLLD